MKWEIKRWTKYPDGATEEAAETAREHFEIVGLSAHLISFLA
jgi:hypothetical protein